MKNILNGILGDRGNQAQGSGADPSDYRRLKEEVKDIARFKTVWRLKPAIWEMNRVATIRQRRAALLENAATTKAPGAMMDGSGRGVWVAGPEKP